MHSAILHRIQADNAALMLCAPANQNDAELREMITHQCQIEKVLQAADAENAVFAALDEARPDLIQQLIERGRA